MYLFLTEYTRAQILLPAAAASAYRKKCNKNNVVITQSTKGRSICQTATSVLYIFWQHIKHVYIYICCRHVGFPAGHLFCPSD